MVCKNIINNEDELVGDEGKITGSKLVKIGVLSLS